MPYIKFDASSFGDWQMRVLCAIAHFKSRMVPEDTNNGHNGFALPNVIVRRKVFCGLYWVMHSWHRISSLSQDTAAAAERLLHKFLATDLVIAKVGLTSHYTNSYNTVIERSSLLPHRL